MGEVWLYRFHDSELTDPILQHRFYDEYDTFDRNTYDNKAWIEHNTQTTRERL